MTFNAKSDRRALCALCCKMVQQREVLFTLNCAGVTQFCHGWRCVDCGMTITAKDQLILIEDAEMASDPSSILVPAIAPSFTIAQAEPDTTDGWRPGPKAAGPDLPFGNK